MDLRKHIKDNKGVVRLQNATAFEDKLLGSLEKEYSLGSDAEEDAGESAARTRPLVKISFRKRKLVQTANLHNISKKAGRPR